MNHSIRQAREQASGCRLKKIHEIIAGRLIVKLDDEICYCFHISKRKITNFIRIHKPRVPSQISECGGAGTGCGWCIGYLKKLFQHVPENRAEETDDLTPEEYARRRGAYIRAGRGVPPPGATPPPLETPDGTDESPEPN